MVEFDGGRGLGRDFLAGVDACFNGHGWIMWSRWMDTVGGIVVLAKRKKMIQNNKLTRMVSALLA